MPTHAMRPHEWGTQIQPMSQKRDMGHPDTALCNCYATSRCSPRAASRRLQVDADDLGDAGFLHGDAIDDVGHLHGALGVGHHQELSGGGKPRDEIGEATDVGLVERRVHLVEHAEGRGLELEDADQQAESAVRAFSPPERSMMFCNFLPGGEATMSMPDSAVFFCVGEAHEGLSAAEEFGEGCAEVAVDDLEGRVELDPRDLVDLA